ncbi:MAG: hypothetical protein ONB44_17540 [candidate division KSB1 bacterium]|nr:hypothetical protein [candidate division KSB1 bacterium]MDZ7303930.1 hypothetical protein [candidate division KSB1 bacterium]MDZ7313091.1 hypothetical protein [candidate division KSB1 bacterium]
MEVDEIRKVAKARPFKAFELHVENGERYLIPHPENIFITNQIIVTVDERGQSILIAPEAVSTICLVEDVQKVNA